MKGVMIVVYLKNVIVTIAYLITIIAITLLVLLYFIFAVIVLPIFAYYLASHLAPTLMDIEVANTLIGFTCLLYALRNLRHLYLRLNQEQMKEEIE